MSKILECVICCKPIPSELYRAHFLSMHNCCDPKDGRVLREKCEAHWTGFKESNVVDVQDTEILTIMREGLAELQKVRRTFGELMDIRPDVEIDSKECFMLANIFACLAEADRLACVYLHGNELSFEEDPSKVPYDPNGMSGLAGAITRYKRTFANLNDNEKRKIRGNFE